MDLDFLEKKLNNISSELKTQNVNLNQLIQNNFLKDDTNNLYDILDDDKKHYLFMKKKYKNLIQNYSKAYLELSEWYVGEDLSYKEYCKIFRKTYLDTPKDIQELYSLFLFYSIFSLYLQNIQ